jgi:hypothetical protein
MVQNQPPVSPNKSHFRAGLRQETAHPQWIEIAIAKRPR